MLPGKYMLYGREIAVLFLTVRYFIYFADKS